MDNLKILPTGLGFDYINNGLPTLSVNPDRVGRTWLNITTGEIFVCVDNNVDENKWKGQLGSTINVPVTADYISRAWLEDVNMDSSTGFGTMVNNGAIVGSIGPNGNNSVDFPADTYITASSAAIKEVGDGDFSVSLWASYTDATTWTWLFNIPESSTDQDPSFTINYHTINVRSFFPLSSKKTFSTFICFFTTARCVAISSCWFTSFF